MPGKKQKFSRKNLSKTDRQLISALEGVQARLPKTRQWDDAFETMQQAVFRLVELGVYNQKLEEELRAEEALRRQDAERDPMFEYEE